MRAVVSFFDTSISCLVSVFSFFFFNDTATTEIYTLSLHDALPIWQDQEMEVESAPSPVSTLAARTSRKSSSWSDRKSTRLNSSHGYISYAVFCLKKKNRQRSCLTSHVTCRARTGQGRDSVVRRRPW